MKIKKARGKGFPCFKVLPLLLSFIILFCSFPITAFADTEFTANNVIIRRYQNNSSTFVYTQSSSLPLNFSSVGIKDGNDTMNNVTRLVFIGDGNLICDKNDTINFQLKLRLYLFSHFDTVAIRITNSDGNTILYRSLSDVTVNHNSINNLFDITDTASVKSTGAVRIVVNCTGGTRYEYNDGYTSTLQSFYITVTDNKTSLLDSIIAIVNNIKTNLQNLPNTINGYISLATAAIQTSIDSIESWLTTVKNGIVTAIGNIQGWLTNVKEGIVSAVNSIETWLTNLAITIKNNLLGLFVPPSSWWDSYKSSWDSWINLHFGALIQVKTIYSGLFTDFAELYDGELADDVTITFPAIKLPHTVFGGRNDKVLFNGTTISLGQNISDFGLGTFFFDTWDVMVSVICVFALIVFIKKQYNRIFAENTDMVGDGL